MAYHETAFATLTTEVVRAAEIREVPTNVLEIPTLYTIDFDISSKWNINCDFLERNH